MGEVTRRLPHESREIALWEGIVLFGVRNFHSGPTGFAAPSCGTQATAKARKVGSDMKVSVVGTGHVGLVSGACLAAKNHRVVCVDVERAKVDLVNASKCPIHEEGLPEIIARHGSSTLTNRCPKGSYCRRLVYAFLLHQQLESEPCEYGREHRFRCVIGAAIDRDEPKLLAPQTRVGYRAHRLQRKLAVPAAQFIRRQSSGLCVVAPTNPNLYSVARVGELVESTAKRYPRSRTARGVRHGGKTRNCVHLAAQSVVLQSYADPVETYSSNVLGTVYTLEAIRRARRACVVVNVTSDKCYENKGWVWGYRETDALGGHDPYSNSKACAELVGQCYRNSYFPPSRWEEHRVAMANARAGNVVGGGDWTLWQLISRNHCCVLAVTTRDAQKPPRGTALATCAGLFGRLYRSRRSVGKQRAHVLW